MNKPKFAKLTESEHEKEGNHHEFEPDKNFEKTVTCLNIIRTYNFEIELSILQ